MNRNTSTKYVPAVSVVNGHHQYQHHQTRELKLTIPPFNGPPISTHTLCINGNGLGTMNSLSSNASTNCGSGSGGSRVSGGGSGGESVGGPLENLPKKFVSSMRTLFDIMDDKRTGFVKLSDIEARWQDDGSNGLPHGVIDCLRRVTPISGMLSFERFCAGLKICLLRNQTANDCAAMTKTKTTTPPPLPQTFATTAPLVTMGSIGSAAAAAAKLMRRRRSSIDSLISENSSNSNNNDKMNNNNLNGNGHITNNTHCVNDNSAVSAAAATAATVNTIQHNIKNIHLHIMNNDNDHINNHSSSSSKSHHHNRNNSINSDENNNDNNNSNHNHNNRKRQTIRIAFYFILFYLFDFGFCCVGN